MTKMLATVFNENAAYQTVISLMGVWARFCVAGGLRPNLAIEKSVVLDWVSGALAQKGITLVQALAFLSTNVLVHRDSQGNDGEYLQRAITLYNASTMDDVCKAESLRAGTKEYRDMFQVYSFAEGTAHAKMQTVKSACYKSDIISGSRRGWIGRVLGLFDPVNAHDIAMLPNVTIRDVAEQREKDKAIGKGQKYQLLPLEQFYPVLLAQRKSGRMTETQCALFLCFILHGLEARANDESYIDHPMAVAGMVQEFGPRILNGRRDLVSQAMLAALLHDCGEHTEFKVDKHLPQLLSPEVATAVKTLHLKKGEETYFQYIQRIAQNPVAALVKLCDIVHNTDGHAKTKLKQDYVYRLAAAYLRASIEHPQEVAGRSVREWALMTEVVGSDKDFDRIENIAKKDTTEKGVGISFKLTAPVNHKYLSQIRSPEYAHTRGEQKLHL